MSMVVNELTAINNPIIFNALLSAIKHLMFLTQINTSIITAVISITMNTELSAKNNGANNLSVE